ncbi:MAG TPA: Rieske 2Fe-2S domain-containing protein [Xanthobacteraceae bacterium]|nr:Rieske 2Fe-2S domain-containing protein [Xanthobacteraceae bacterium]
MSMERNAPGGGAARAVGPDCPQNWYLLAGSAELGRGGILARRLGGLEIVLYRGHESGRAAAFAAHCAHAGCHLRHGEVIGDHLQCALHRRVIRADGRFIAPDRSPLATAPQPCLPTIERFGCIFVFAGETATFDLPTPDISALGPITTRALPSRSFALPWSTLISNGMDIDHLQAVHDRRLREPPTLRRLDPYRMRLDYRAQVTGRHLSDRMMKWIAEDDIRTSITCIGGSMMLVESSVGRHRTFVMLSMCPDRNAGSTIRAVVGVPGEPHRLAARTAARVAAWLFHAFLRKDVGVLQGMQWHEPEDEITQGDALTRSLCAFFRSLPAFAPAPEQPVPRTPLRAASGGA